MRKILLRLALVLLVVGATSVVPFSSAVKDRTLIGFISDNHCGLRKHMKGMSDKDCVLMCVKNGKFVLADRDHKRVYQLDQAGQEKASEFAGQKAKVTGRVTGKTIHVTSIEATS